MSRIPIQTVAMKLVSIRMKRPPIAHADGPRYYKKVSTLATYIGISIHWVNDDCSTRLLFVRIESYQVVLMTTCHRSRTWGSVVVSCVIHNWLSKDNDGPFWGHIWMDSEPDVDEPRPSYSPTADLTMMCPCRLKSFAFLAPSMSLSFFWRLPSRRNTSRVSQPRSCIANKHKQYRYVEVQDLRRCESEWLDISE